MSLQSNVTPFVDEARLLRSARGAFVKSLIDQEERSARFVAVRIGLAPSSMSERLKGKSPFLADELEGIARVLRIDPVEFYGRYISVKPGGFEPGAANQRTSD
jgi:transcriptional regulator with XRE-family HTH domain